MFCYSYRDIHFRASEQIEATAAACRAVLLEIQVVSQGDWQVGTTKVFMRYIMEERLLLRLQHICEMATVITTAVRKFLAQKTVKALREARRFAEIKANEERRTRLALEEAERQRAMQLALEEQEAERQRQLKLLAEEAAQRESIELEAEKRRQQEQAMLKAAAATVAAVAQAEAVRESQQIAEKQVAMLAVGERHEAQRPLSAPDDLVALIEEGARLMYQASAQAISKTADEVPPTVDVEAARPQSSLVCTSAWLLVVVQCLLRC